MSVLSGVLYELLHTRLCNTARIAANWRPGTALHHEKSASSSTRSVISSIAAADSAPPLKDVLNRSPTSLEYPRNPNMGASIGQFHASEGRTGWASCSVRTITLKAIFLREFAEVEDIMFLGLPHRLPKVLLHLYRRSSTNGAPNKIHITQPELSQMRGASRESTNKQLHDWQRRKWLRLESNSVVVLAPEASKGLIYEGPD